MTLVAIEGFDALGTTTGAAGSADVVAGMQAKYSGEFENGNDAVVHDGWGSGRAIAHGYDSSAGLNYTLVPIGAAKVTIIAGMAFKPRKSPHASQPFLIFYDISEAKNHVVVDCVYGNSLRVRRGAAGVNLLGIVYDCFRPDRWVYVEVKATIDNSAGAVEVKINGVQRLNLTSVDTNDGATTPQITHVKLVGGAGTADSGATVYLHDDVYVVNTDGAVNNTFLGPGKVETFFPDAEGDNIDFTPSSGTNNALMVDENPRDDDTTYNESGTTGHYDLLTNVDALVTITGGIKGMQLNTDARVTDASPVDMINKLKSNVTEDEATAQQVSDSAEYTTFYDIWEQDPDTSTAWTVSGVNAVQVGYEIG